MAGQGSRSCPRIRNRPLLLLREFSPSACFIRVRSLRRGCSPRRSPNSVSLHHGWGRALTPSLTKLWRSSPPKLLPLLRADSIGSVSEAEWLTPGPVHRFDEYTYVLQASRIWSIGSPLVRTRQTRGPLLSAAHASGYTVLYYRSILLP